MHKDDKVPGLIGLGLYLGLSNLAHIAIGVTDVLMAGMLGSFLLAAATLAATLFHVVMLSCVGFCAGCAPLLSKYKGKDNPKAYQTRLIGVVGCLLIIIGLCIAILYIGDDILLAFGQDERLITASLDYLFYLTLTLPVAGLFSFLWIIASLNGQGSSLFWITLVSIFVNMGLNSVFMFGWRPIEASGLAGLGISTFVTFCLETIFLLFWLRLKSNITALPVEGIDLQQIILHLPEIIRYGVPMMILECATLAFFAVLTFFVGLLGPTQLAIHAITLQMAEIGTGLAFGFSEAISIVIARYMGQQNQLALQRSCKQAILFGSGAMIIYGLCLIVFGQEITSLFLNFSNQLDIQITQEVVSLLTIAAICLIVDCARIVLIGILRGLGDSHAPISLTIGSFWFIAIPFSYILAFQLDWSIKGIWWGMAFGFATGSVLLIWRFHKVWTHLVNPKRKDMISPLAQE